MPGGHNAKSDRLNERELANLVKNLSDESAAVREQAALQLAEMGAVPEETIPALIAALASPEWEVGLPIARVLGQVGTPAIPSLRLAVRDRSPETRGRAADALRWMGPGAASAIPDLAEALKDKEEGVRRHAAEALGAIGEEALPCLRQALASDDPDVQDSSIHGLGAMHSTGLPDLRQLMQSPIVRIRICVVWAMGIRPDTIPDLREALKDPDERVRAAAARVLGKMPIGLAAAADLHTALADDTICRAAEDSLHSLYEPPLKMAERLIAPGEDRVTGLRRVLSEGNPEDRRLAVWVLYHSGSDALHNDLLKCLADESEEVRCTAIWALVNCDAITELCQALSDRRKRVRVAAARGLGSIRPPTEQTIAVLAKRLSDRAEEVRCAAARSLARIGPAARKATPELLGRLSDESEHVRAAAAWAIGQIGRMDGDG